MHPHPLAGKHVRLHLGDNLQAVEDLTFHNKRILLENWVDQIAVDAEISHSEIKCLLSFYAHRCLPDRPVDDEISLDEIDTRGLVYGRLSEPPAGFNKRGEHRIVFHESEINAID